MSDTMDYPKCEPERLIFLDFDGVIRTPSWNGECISNLNWLTKHSGARFVVSSDWRYSHSMDDLKSLLESVGVAGGVVGVTHCDDFATLESSREFLRALEIDFWIKSRTIASYTPLQHVILDDLPLGRTFLGGHGTFVQTSFERGLTFELARMAWSILVQRPENEAPSK